MEDTIPETIGNDVLLGAAAIAAFLGLKRHQAFRMLETGSIPGFKLAGRWVARRSTLLNHFEKLEQGDAA